MPQGSSISSPASRNADLPRGEENESETTTTRKVAAPFEQLQLTPRNLAYAHVVGKLRPPLATAVIRLGSDLYIWCVAVVIQYAFSWLIPRLQ